VCKNKTGNSPQTTQNDKKAQKGDRLFLCLSASVAAFMFFRTFVTVVVNPHTGNYPILKSDK
jgi:hypothetical protein